MTDSTAIRFRFILLFAAVFMTVCALVGHWGFGFVSLGFVAAYLRSCWDKNLPSHRFRW